MAATLLWHPYVEGCPAPYREHKFHPTRRWRFDYAWPQHLIAVEQDGGLWVKGRHSRGAGRLKDYEKDREAMLLGWRVGRFSPQEVNSGVAAEWVKRMIERRDLLSQIGAAPEEPTLDRPAFSPRSKHGRS